jgi:hypothetical protein
MKHLFLIATFFIAQYSLSQHIVFQNLNTSGGIITDQNVNVSFTFGQPIVSTISNDSNIITQGFQQTNSIFGCVDSLACNFNSEVNEDDGSCYYPDTIYTEVSSCSESYHWNGQTYTESGVYESSPPTKKMIIL